MKYIKSEKEYLKYFPKKKRKKALEQAWKNRDFEIQMYWRRANYFWAFIVSIFGAYLLINTSEKFADENVLNIGLLLLGLIFSVCWVAVNIGSKKWQENWEYHIDLLEDDITGPIYKTALVRKAHSVSKVNLFSSRIITLSWLILLLYKLGWLSVIKSSFISYPCWYFISIIILIGILLLFGIPKKISKYFNKSKTYYFEHRPTKYKYPGK